MAWDPGQEAQIRAGLEHFQALPGEVVGEKKMFGGLCFTLNDKMLVGVGKGEIMVRATNEDMAKGLQSGELKEMDFTGKPLKNFAYLAHAEDLSAEEFGVWIDRSAGFLREIMFKKGTKKK